MSGQTRGESLQHGANTIQTEPVVPNSTGGGSAVTTSGAVVSSSNPTTNPNASVSEKLKGDVKGAIQGSIGAVQAAAGTTIRNKDMEAKGFEKMQEEDQRLAAKRGVMPVGSDLRNTTTDADTNTASAPK